MNHRPIFASLDFPRYLLPGNYHYKNWNLASVKGFQKISDDEMLIYGNTGIWKTDKDFKFFTDFNAGFPKGIDHRKIFSIKLTTNGQLFAGTLFGLYQYDQSIQKWKHINLPDEDARVVKLIEKDNKLFILSRSDLWTMDLYKKQGIETIIIPAPSDYKGKAGLFRTMWVIHSGEIFGLVGKIVVDVVALAVIFMTLTGFFYTFLPKFAKKIQEKNRKRLQKLNRTTINWHTLIGVYGIPVLIITVVTGMFLRPPLLIPIAGKQVTAIPGTVLASENVWHDKLRDIIYDTTGQQFYLSTSEGFFAIRTDGLKYSTNDIQVQPPVSVMGINVLEDLGNGHFLVGSFSGLFEWTPSQNLVTDAITGQQITSYSQGNPFGSVAVAGVYMDNNKPAGILNYDSGWMSFGPYNSPEMPEVIKEQPISWWNLALEVHTGRIFEFIFGMFYILYVPLMGILVLLIIITGFLMYWKSKKKKTKAKKHGNTQLAGSTKGSF